MKLWARAHPERVRFFLLRRKYGITPEEYEAKLKKQKNRCAICGRHKRSFKFRLGVDHNHKTLKVRGLLCPLCNAGLGAFLDDIKLLKKAIRYLSYWHGGIEEQ